MINALEKMFKKHPSLGFSKLVDKSAIATLNRNQAYYLADGDRLYDFITNGMIMTMEVNHNINFDYIQTMKIDGKTQSIYSAKRFKELVVAKYQ